MRKVSVAAKQAYNRAVNNDSYANYPAIYSGFAAKGIPESEVHPRENVFSFGAWIAQGRVVRKGQKGVKIFTFVPMDKTEKDGTVNSYRRPRTVSVFHVSQTEKL